LPDPKLPLVPGHEIVGTIVEAGNDVRGLRVGERVGIPWLASTCGTCRYCLAGQENLCDFARFTGYDVDGGYAEYALADSRYCFPLPADRDPHALAPWLCAGLIGYRALRFAGDGKRIGIYGFGAAAHMIAQVCRYQQREVFAFTRPGDEAAQAFACKLGAVWAGGSDQAAPCELDAALLFAPVGALVPKALRDVRKAGRVVCAGIHMSDIPSFPYAILWGERCVRSVANLTRRDAVEFIALAQRANLESSVVPYPLSEANDALRALRDGTVVGAAVLDPKR
jgi:alcohol dehydrogenase, propanol-preferring